MARVQRFSGTDLTLALFDIEKQDVLTSNIVDGVRLNSQIGSQVSQGAEFAAAFTLPGQLRVDTHVAWTWQAEFGLLREPRHRRDFALG